MNTTALSLVWPGHTHRRPWLRDVQPPPLPPPLPLPLHCSQPACYVRCPAGLVMENAASPLCGEMRPRLRVGASIEARGPLPFTRAPPVPPSVTAHELSRPALISTRRPWAIRRYALASIALGAPAPLPSQLSPHVQIGIISAEKAVADEGQFCCTGR